MGYMVEQAESATQEGWDLLIDGSRFNVKNVAGLAGIREHFAAYPDIPVITSRETAAAAAAENIDNAYADPVLDHEQTVKLTRESLTQGKDIAHFSFPAVTLITETTLHIWGLLLGRFSLKTALRNIALNTAARSAGSMAGTAAGAGMLLFGPAEAPIGGFSGAWLVI